MNYWVTSVNGTRESGVTYWNDAAAGRPQYEVTQALVAGVGARTLDYYVYFWDDEPQDSLQTRLDGQLAGIKRDDIVFIQFPMRSAAVYIEALIQYLQEQIGAKCVGIVHDVPSWQRQAPASLAADLTDPASAAYREHAWLARLDGLIVHNQQMAARLRRNFVVAGLPNAQPMVSLGLFGYSAQRNTMAWRRELTPVIDYAGNLTKAGFLLAVPRSVQINVFGQELETHDQLRALTNNQLPNITYRGNFDHEAIVQLLPGSFGLCWSSDSYPFITGRGGDYEKYNSPYKAAMYLAADEPLIVAKQAALAEFVEAHGIGIVLNDLSELTAQLATVTPETYAAMLERVHRVGNLVRQNFPIKRAAMEMIDRLEWRVTNEN